MRTRLTRIGLAFLLTGATIGFGLAGTALAHAGSTGNCYLVEVEGVANMGDAWPEAFDHGDRVFTHQHVCFDLSDSPGGVVDGGVCETHCDEYDQVLDSTNRLETSLI